jgi:long-chain acyl-CoA synthetase
MVVKDRQLAWSTLPELLAALVAQHGDRHVLEIGGGRLTYGQIDDISTRLAVGFATRGVAKGDIVGGLLANCVESVLCFFACAKLGVI